MRRTVGLGFALFAFFMGLYLLTYRGHPVSTDEMILFDMTESVAQRGNLHPTLMYNVSILTNPTGDPFKTPDDQYEPIQPIFATPLFWIAQHSANFGRMHMVWFLNIPITALTVVLLYAIGLQRGYSVAVSWLGGFLYGSATLAWVYSRFFWREPLVTLFLLACYGVALQLQSRWQHNYKALKLIIALILLFLAGFLSKAAIILALPGLLILVLPPLPMLFKNRASIQRLSVTAIVAILLILLIFNLNLGSGGNRYNLARWQTFLEKPDWGYVGNSLLGYQLSSGRSIWLYSPILLLGLGGMLMLWRQGQWRLVVAVLLSIFIFSFSYGLSRRALWWGGNGWGPRYLLLLVPPMMLLVFPTLEYLLNKGCQLRWRLAAGLLALVSIGIQILGIAVYQWDYYDLLRDKQILPWQEGLWSIKWSPIPQYLDLWQTNKLDMAWRFATPHWQAPLLAMGLMVGSGLVAIFLARRPATHPAFIPAFSIIACLLIGGTAYSWLVTLQNDTRYTLNRPDIQAMIDYLQKQTNSEDIVFLENPDYQLPLMNSLKSPGLLMTLPYAPGEIRNPNVQPQVVSDDPGAQAGYHSVYAMKWGAEHYQRVWLIMSYGPFIDFALRPQEHWLAQSYFWVETIETSPSVRAIRFNPTPAPGGAPAHIVPNYFNEELLLVGYDLPHGTVYHQGDVLPISLLWQPLKPLPEDYLVSVRLLKADGSLVAQQDGLPQASFGHTSRWIPEQFYRDNHGLQIPHQLTPGQYTIEVVVYSWPSNTRLPVISDTQKGDTAQLTTIEIR
ncbi:MAG: hypothetical protein HY862_10095 [Chloroflexi bacterium]|nr:hypothetical protein [Chloroflexota bacterium]